MTPVYLDPRGPLSAESLESNVIKSFLSACLPTCRSRPASPHSTQCGNQHLLVWVGTSGEADASLKPDSAMKLGYHLEPQFLPTFKKKKEEK